jgi:hypothetical protein
VDGLFGLFDAAVAWLVGQGWPASRASPESYVVALVTSRSCGCGPVTRFVVYDGWVGQVLARGTG